MALFVIADTHLGIGIDKTMDKFGPRWHDHTRRLAENWRAVVKPSDWVLVPGDISWALNIAEAKPDLAYLDALPGQKLLLRGNHDYWWQGLSKLRRQFADWGYDSLHLLQNDAHYLESEKVIVVGSRGWLLPGDPKAKTEDLKIYERELHRLEISLQAGAKLFAELGGVEAGNRLIAMLHYPPFKTDLRPLRVSELCAKYGVERVYYGHVHQPHTPYKIMEQKIAGIYYSLIAGDHLAFKPHRVPADGQEQEMSDVRSMTGYGRAQNSTEQGSVQIELRGVNHRYHELYTRLPQELLFLESEIRQTVKEVAKRGKLELKLIYQPGEGQGEEPQLNREKLQAYLRAYSELAEFLELREEPTMADFWQLPDILDLPTSLLDEELGAKDQEFRELVMPCLEQALQQFVASRQREGAFLKDDLLANLEELNALRLKIAELAPRLQEHFRTRLLRRLGELLAEEYEEYYPEQRLATELAILADKVAIDEELSRLAAHFAAMEKHLSTGGVIGKQLDFLAQEMNREVNTIASKSGDLEITEAALKMKNLVEKIREQLQNIE
ncbi:MAG: YicC/YloC family endoribonuclease [Eubacteriales bacterium]|nr:YicC/YloC family endoribonuclease [Eubacteriales bacterium]